MKTKHLFLLLLAIVASTSMVFAWDYKKVQIGDLYYNLDATAETAEVTSGGSYSGSVVIPESITYNAKTYRVKSIGYRAFSDCSILTSVTIPNSVIVIGQEAFVGCSNLTSVTIPNSVIYIGYYAFSGCTSLPVIDHIRYADTYLAEAVDKTLNSYKIKEGTRIIGDHSFKDCCSLTSITIPSSVTIIGDCAFDGCTSLPVIDNIRYADTYLVGAVDRTLSSCKMKEGTRFIGSSAFSNCSKLTSVTIPNSVTSIGVGAFSSCTNLTSITIPNSVTRIGYWAFSDCGSLNSITIPNGVTSIELRTFSGCSSLTSVTIPNSVTCIDEGAFENSSSLTSITIPNSVTSIGKSAFYNCSSLTSITIPNGVTSIGSSAFSGCSSLTSITIPSSVTSIGESAFNGCSSLKDVFVPCNDLERIKQLLNIHKYTSDENYLYSNRVKVTPSPYVVTIKDTKYGSVLVPAYNDCNESVMITAIPDQGCYFVKWSDGSIDNPRTVYLTKDQTFTAIFNYTLTDQCGKDKLLTWTLDTLKMAMEITGRGALSENYTYSTTFASLTIGNEVTAIGASAFSGCTNLKNIILGSALKIIESGAFACSDIKTITCYSQRPPTVNNGAFCNLDYETIIYVPKDYVSTYLAHAFWGVYDVRPIGASGTETDQVKVEPSETTATVAWPTINGAGSYELVIRDKDGNALCTLVFNAQGQLTSIDFAAAAAPARDRSNVAAMAQGAGFAFTVTGLESGTMYKYSFITKNASGTVIDTKTGVFTTQSPTALEDIMDNVSSSSSVRKVLQNGQLYILRDGKVYNAVGAEVK